MVKRAPELTICIPPGPALPVNLATETFGVLARRGSGKTYAASILAEELLDAGVPVVVIDPLGAWWGLKSNREGNGPGYPVVVFGGDHADLPLEAGHGRLLAEVVVGERIPTILDLSHLSKRASRQLVADFLERLYEVNREVLHLIVDEADLFAPQRHGPETARMLGAMEDMVRRGRSRGLGVTLISQRPASVNKDVLTQVSVLLAMRMTGKQDVSAIDDWVRLHAEEDDAKEVKATLGGLATGTGWLWSTVPGFTRLEQVQIRLRRTFDSSSTPKVGERRVTPTAFADLNLGRLAVLLEAGEVPEVSEVSGRGRRAPSRPRVPASAPAAPVVDPRVGQLQRQVADLKEQLAAARDELGVSRQARAAADRARQVMRQAADMLWAGSETVTPTVTENLKRTEQTVKTPKPLRTVAPAAPVPPPLPARPRPTSSRVSARTVEESEKLPRAQEKILAVLARDGTRNTRQIALLTGYSGKSGGYRNALSSLRTAGYITGRGDLSITPEGEAAVGQWEQLPEGQALVHWWLERLGRAEREILSTVVSAWPNPISVPDIAEVTGYSPTSGGFRNALSRLRTLGLAEGRGDLRADDTLGQAWNDQRPTG